MLAAVEGDLVRREHRLALEHTLAVEVHLRHGRDSVERERQLLAGLRGLRLQTRPEPPVLGVEVASIARRPQSVLAQRRGRGAGHPGGHPLELVQARLLMHERG